MKELVLYRCEICGNIIAMIEDSGIVPECCGAEMTRIPVNNEESGAGEKHVPVLEWVGNLAVVNIGSMPHPMTEEHHICWIALHTCRGMYVRKMDPGKAPAASFVLEPKETVKAVYAWCNIHGLWKKEISE